ncbi:hypothetical protein GQ457_03G016620 [Hibiscus cannabinus]
MHKDLILLKTVKSFYEIAVGELELQLKYDTGSPEKVSNPLYESTKDLLHSALRKGIAKILEKQNLALPEKMTHSELVDKLIDTQVVDQFIVEPPDLMRIYNLLEDLILSWHPLSYHFFSGMPLREQGAREPSGLCSGSPRFWCFGHLSMAVRGISLLSNGKRASPRKCPFACRWGSKSDFIVPRNSVTWPANGYDNGKYGKLTAGRTVSVPTTEEGDPGVGFHSRRLERP